jgi:hypothetical protein
MTQRPDEFPHAVGDSPEWLETWELDFVVPGTEASDVLGGVLRQTPNPRRGVVSYSFVLLGEGRDLIAVIDHEVPLAVRAWRDGGLELRTSGLWSDLEVETPLEHVSLGVEAFGVALVDPATARGDARGVRVPVGLDLEWESDSLPRSWIPPHFAGDGYELTCRVLGEVLVGSERFMLDTGGARRHWWGVPVPIPDLFPFPVSVPGEDDRDGTQTDGSAVAGSRIDVDWWVVAWAPLGRSEVWTLLRSPDGRDAAWRVHHGSDATMPPPMRRPTDDRG